MKTIRLMAIDGMLFFPMGGMDLDAETVEETYGRADKPSVLLRYYPAGDVDVVPWPWTQDYTERLAIALYDERECNKFFPSDAAIELPDGTPFDFDSHVK